MRTARRRHWKLDLGGGAEILELRVVPTELLAPPAKPPSESDLGLPPAPPAEDLLRPVIIITIPLQLPIPGVPPIPLPIPVPIDILPTPPIEVLPPAELPVDPGLFPDPLPPDIPVIPKQGGDLPIYV